MAQDISIRICKDKVLGKGSVPSVEPLLARLGISTQAPAPGAGRASL